MSFARHGQAEMIHWFTRFMLLIVAVVCIVLLVKVFADRDATSPELTRAAYLYRVYYGTALNYVDDKTGRVYPGIIDAEKFTSKTLDSAFVEKEKSEYRSVVSSKIEFLPAGQCAITLENPIYNDKATYQAVAPLAQGGAQGPSSETVLFPVTMRRGNDECGGALNITVVKSQ